MLKKIFINLLILICIISLAEFYCFSLTKSENEAFKMKADKLESNNTRAYKTQYQLLKPFIPTVYRNSFYTDSKKSPIIWFGCSYAEGAGLEDNQTPCYKISQLTGRSCINKAKGATGTQFMYYQLNNDSFKKEVPEAEYIIYTFIWNHFQRLYNYQVNPLINMFNLRYEIKNGELKEINPSFVPIYSSFFIKRLLNKKIIKQEEIESNNFTLFNKIMEESVNITKKNYPNSKFLLLEYPDRQNKKLPLEEIEKLKKMGITVVDIEELFTGEDIYDNKFWLPDNIHPTEAAWNLILPQIKEKYLNN